MNLPETRILAFNVLWMIDIIGWWLTLFLWVIPTISSGLFGTWSLVAIISFYVVWMPLMALGVIIGLTFALIIVVGTWNF